MVTDLKKKYRELVSLKEASEILHIHPSILRRWNKKEILKAIRFVQRKNRHYSFTDLQKLVKINNLPEVTSPQKNKDIISTQLSNIKTDTAQDSLNRLELIVNALFESVTPEKTADLIARQIVDSMKAASCVVLHYTGDNLHLLGQHGNPKKIIKKWQTIPLTVSIPATDAIRTKKPVILGSFEESKTRYPTLIKKSFLINTHAFVSLPLTINHHIFGAVCIGFAERRTFTKDEINFMLSLARTCALAIERARLHEQEKDSQKESEELKDLLQKINTAASLFLVPLNPQEMYKMITREAKKIMDAEKGSIFLWQNNELKRVYASHAVLYTLKLWKKGRAYKAFLEKKASVSYIGEYKEFDPMLKQLKVKTVICIPLSHENKAIGVMVMLAQKHMKFSKKELDVLKLYGTLASLAVVKSKLYTEAKNSLENQKLYFSLASHEIKTPLTALNAFIQILERQVTKTNPSLLTQIQRLGAEAKRLNQLVSEFLGQKNIDFGTDSYNWQACHLQEIIESAYRDFAVLFPSHKVIVKNNIKTSNDMIWGDFNKLLQVFINVLQNAGKYSPKGSKITLTLKEKQASFTISIKDEGKGIAQKDIAHIFSKFYRASGHEQKGMGLGLYLVQTIITNHKGSATVKSKINQGTTITIQLPKFQKIKKKV